MFTVDGPQWQPERPPPRSAAREGDPASGQGRCPWRPHQRQRRRPQGQQDRLQDGPGRHLLHHVHHVVINVLDAADPAGEQGEQTADAGAPHAQSACDGSKRGHPAVPLPSGQAAGFRGRGRCDPEGHGGVCYLRRGQGLQAADGAAGQGEIYACRCVAKVWCLSVLVWVSVAPFSSAQCSVGNCGCESVWHRFLLPSAVLESVAVWHRFPLPSAVLESVVSMLSTVSQCGTVSAAHCGVGRCCVYAEYCESMWHRFLCPLLCWKVLCLC